MCLGGVILAQCGFPDKLMLSEKGKRLRDRPRGEGRAECVSQKTVMPPYPLARAWTPKNKHGRGAEDRTETTQHAVATGGPYFDSPVEGALSASLILSTSLVNKTV